LTVLRRQPSRSCRLRKITITLNLSAFRNWNSIPGLISSTGTSRPNHNYCYAANPGRVHYKTKVGRYHGSNLELQN
jgi:hypothetical protein